VAVVEDPQFVASWRDSNRRHPLVSSRRVVVYLERSAPGCAAIGGLDEEHLGLVRTGALVVVGPIDVAAHRVDRGVRELVSPKGRETAGALTQASRSQAGEAYAGRP
jgi:hypothetical protein